MSGEEYRMSRWELAISDLLGVITALLFLFCCGWPWTEEVLFNAILYYI